MKKVLLLVLGTLLLLPMIVFADTSGGSYSTNTHVMVGGYKEIDMFAAQNNSDKNILDIKIDYDPEYFRITKDDITIYNCVYEKINKNDVNITISNGKITINSTKALESQYCYENWNFKIHFDFLALKTGKSDIKLDGLYAKGTASSTITEAPCPKCEEKECPKCEEKECPKCEECPAVEEGKECPACEEKECPVCEETKCPEPVEEKNFIKDNAIILMIACFVVGAVLSFLILPLFKKKDMPTPQ